MNMVRRLVSEPLIQFLAIGLFLYALSLSIGADQRALRDAGRQILVDQRTVERLESQFEATWRRIPTSEERARLIEEHIREEILVREARALGLDRSDGGIRTRLRQLMEQLLFAPADQAPEDAVLEAYLDANRESFRLPERIAFEQIFLGSNPSEEAAAGALAAVANGADAADLGTPTLLPEQLRLSPPTAVDAVFGQGFFDRMSRYEVGVWAGPTRSAYGDHLVRLLAREPSRTPPLAEIRSQVLHEWMQSERARLRETVLSEMRARYEIRREDHRGTP